jgi:hypothetical protein
MEVTVNRRVKSARRNGKVDRVADLIVKKPKFVLLTVPQVQLTFQGKVLGSSSVRSISLISGKYCSVH